MRRQGASKGATASFLISTPETGVDSIALTYALLDPLMTLLRPLAAFITATLTGFGITIFDRNARPVVLLTPTRAKEQCACGADKRPKLPIGSRIIAGLKYAFFDLLGGIGGWLLIGIVIAGGVSVWIPPSFIEKHLGTGIGSMLMMLIIGAPLYVCATGSTPIAAALALKGLSPGAAMVFLLAGPATNMASLIVVSKIIGRRAMVIYLTGIVVCSLVIGILTNYCYMLLGLDVSRWITSDITESSGWLNSLLALILIGFIAFNRLRKHLSRPPQADGSTEPSAPSTWH